MQNIVRSFCLIVVSLFIASCTTTADAGDMRPKVVAIGDLHGDFAAYMRLLKEAGLVDGRGRWSGGNDVFVQTGDIPDRGPDSLKIIRHLKELQIQASAKGGEVVTLVGNHEAMNVTGDLRYVHPDEYRAFANRKSESVRNRFYKSYKDAIETAYLKRDPTMSSEAIRAEWNVQTPLGMIEHQLAWRPEGEIGDWVSRNPAVAIVGETLFVHGGISEKYAEYSIDEINRLTTEALKMRALEPGSIINDELGPMWYRGLIRREEPTSGAIAADAEISDPRPKLSMESETELVLKTYGVKRIVVGHTPSLSGIVARYGNKLIQIDTGISQHYGGTQSYLRIENGKIYANDNSVETIIGDPQ